MRGLLAIILLALAGCGSFPLVLAEANCRDRARTLDQPTFSKRVASRDENGITFDVEIERNSDYAPNRDPAEFFDFCVRQIAGQPPSLPLYSRTDWKR